MVTGILLYFSVCIYIYKYLYIYIYIYTHIIYNIYIWMYIYTQRHRLYSSLFKEKNKIIYGKV